MLAASQISAQTNTIGDSDTNSIDSTNNPAQAVLELVMTEDDAAMDEVDSWIRTNNAGESKEELNHRIHARLDGVRQKYQDFLEQYPNYEPGHLAYGSFMDDIGNEDLASVEYETASELNPKDPAAWNDLANYYGEHGPLTNAFIDYQKAIDLNASEPVYYRNLATLVYLYRRDAMSFYQITEPQVFDKSLELYRKAVQLDPHDFELASDYAESYYGIKPLRTNDALVAWTNALSSAETDVEREAVFIHLARIKFLVGRYEEAKAQLDAVTNSMYDDLKSRIERNIALKEHPPTNAVPVSLPGTNAPPILIATNLPPEIATNVVFPPALTNPPPVSTNVVNILTNVPPVNPTNLLNSLQTAPPEPRAISPPQ